MSSLLLRRVWDSLLIKALACSLTCLNGQEHTFVF